MDTPRSLPWLLVLCPLLGAGEPLVVTSDLTLEEGAVLARPIVIRASHVTLDGNGATVRGPGKAGAPASFEGVGISAEGCSGVAIRNIKVRGFRVGIAVSDGEGWRIEGCDVSGNFHDPEYGWGDLGRFGGMVLTRMARSAIRGSTAHAVWNAIDLVECHDNIIAGNDFSHTSNVCAKLWTSSRNVFADNDLSYGLRIRT
ncbi:MAG: right-handed parallel beta-helix repeat-containing protein, partial [Planctomycetes bacterium]|nr:right-handed parallel beta-helix repeat-containing protein [Planctomycetota bacterium]